MKKLKDNIANWQRFHFIVRTFAKHGFSWLIYELGFATDRERSSANSSLESVPKQLRLAFEELGPTFIKLGQVLSTRPDLIPPEYVEEFCKLTDQIPCFPYQDVKKILHEEFGGEPEELFDAFESKPIAAASISQVHRAKISHGGVWKRVVVKVQRPDIHQMIQNDIQILYFLAQTLEKFRKNLRMFNLTGIVEEFQRSIYEELDFSLEAKNIEAFQKNLGTNDHIVIPQVIWERSSKRILTMTEMEGIPLSQVSEFPESFDRKRITESLVTFFLEGMFFHGLFHADAHAGNLLINFEEQKIHLIDFGMVGRLQPALREKLSKIFVSLVSGDFQTLALVYMQIANFGKDVSLSEFRKDIEAMLQPNLEKPLKDIEIGPLLLESTRLAQKYQVKLPRDLIMFYRSIATLEHMGRTLDPDFEFLTYGKKFAGIVLQRRMSSEQLVKDLARIYENVRGLSVEMPGQIRNLLQKIESDQLFPSFKTLEQQIFRSQRAQDRLSLAILSFGGLLSASLLWQSQTTHLFVWPLWGIGVLGALILLWRLVRRE